MQAVVSARRELGVEPAPISDTPRRKKWSPSVGVLLLDAGQLSGWLNERRLQHLGCPFRRARTAEQARQILSREPILRVAILDYDSIRGDAAVVADLRQRHPSVLLLGTSTAERHSDFLALGVEQYLKQPWASEELLLLWGLVAAQASASVQP